jgi:GNAT superfamily N-acetyltransferase
MTSAAAARTLTPVMWTVCAEPVDSADAVALLRDYFAELTVRYFHRETTEQEIDETLNEFPSSGLALFVVLRTDGVPAGCLGLHPTGELTRMYVAPQFGRAGGARALLSAAESWARTQGLTRLFLDTRTDLVEARAFYASCGFIEIPRRPPPQVPSRTTGTRSPSRRRLSPSLAVVADGSVAFVFAAGAAGLLGVGVDDRLAWFWRPWCSSAMRAAAREIPC